MRALPPYVSGWRAWLANRLRDCVEDRTPLPSPGLSLYSTPRGFWYDLPTSYTDSAGFPFQPYAPFALSVAGADVTVGPGTLRRQGVEYDSAEDTITIASDGQYIGWQFDADLGTLTVTGPHDTRPVDSEPTYARGTLYQFGFADGVATLSRDFVHGAIQSGLQ